MMQHYTVHNQTSGALFGEAVADSLDDALDMIARDQGYTDYAALCAVVGLDVDAARADLAVTVEPVILVVEGGMEAHSDSPPTTLDALDDYIEATADNMRDDAGDDAIVDWTVKAVGVDGLGFADRYEVRYRWRAETGEVVESNEQLLTFRPLRCDSDATATVWARHTVQAGQLPTVTDLDQRGEDSDDFATIRLDARSVADLIEAARHYPATFERRAVRSAISTLQAR